MAPLSANPFYACVSRSWLLLPLSAIYLLAGCGSSTSSPATTAPPVVAPSSCNTPTVTITHTAAANNPQLVVLDKNKYPKALCNDGTAGAYVLRPGAGAAANRWIVSLQGGGECFDQASCAARAMNMPGLLSTATVQANPSSAFAQGGLLGTTPGNNPDFYDASVVQVLYCSSDDYSGNKLANGTFNGNDPNTWNFQGRAILNAVIADLTANHGLGTASEFMLTGQSAGGVGVFANANPVAKMVPAGARYVAYSDAGFANNVSNFLATGAPPNYTDPSGASTLMAKHAAGQTLWSGSGDPVCSAATAPDPLLQVNCYSGQTLLAPGGTIALPMLVSEAEKDLNQLGTAGIATAALTSGNFTTAQAGYVNYFAASMRTGLAVTNSNVSLFAPDVLVHVEATDPAIYNTSATFPTGSISLQQQVGQWYKAPCSVQRNIAN